MPADFGPCPPCPSSQNLLCLNIASGLGAVVPNPFFTWTAGAALPAILGLVLTPLLVYKLLPPTVTHTPEAPMQVCCVGVDYQVPRLLAYQSTSRRL